MQLECVQKRVTVGDKEDVQCARDLLCDFRGHWGSLDTSFSGIEFSLSQMSLLVTNVEWGCEVFPECLRPTITAAQQRVPGTVYEMTRITSLHPHCHLKREVLSSVLSADWESEAQRFSCLPKVTQSYECDHLGI